MRDKEKRVRQIYFSNTKFVREKQAAKTDGFSSLIAAGRPRKFLPSGDERGGTMVSFLRLREKTFGKFRYFREHRKSSAIRVVLKIFHLLRQTLP